MRAQYQRMVLMVRVRERAHREAMAAVHGADTEPPPLCKHWMLTGSCKKHAAGLCIGYRHAFDAAEEEARALRGRRSRLQSMSNSEALAQKYNNVPPAAGAWICGTCNGVSKLELSECRHCGGLMQHNSVCTVISEVTPQADPHSMTKQQKSRRAAEFVDWLLRVYGREPLDKGAGVLDVAGGKGVISYELHCRQRIRCTLIDSGVRARLLTPKQAKALRKSGGAPFEHIAAYFDDKFASDQTTGPLLAAASLVVGMHPDEATEPIVDHALENNKKIAVVPCCVFAHLMPNLKLKDGTVVRDVNEFCAYLKEKDPRIQEALLSFEGRNKVIYIP